MSRTRNKLYLYLVIFTSSDISCIGAIFCRKLNKLLKSNLGRYVILCGSISYIFSLTAVPVNQISEEVQNLFFASTTSFVFDRSVVDVIKLFFEEI